MNIQYKNIETINEFIDAIRIRVEVFIKEQGFEPGWEPDNEDKNSKQFIAIVDNKIVATARMREIGNKEFKIERMATLKELRNKGISKGLVKFMIDSVKKSNPNKIWMQSQVQAQRFYEKCGFKVVLKPYDLHGIKHIDMEYTQ